MSAPRPASALPSLIAPTIATLVALTILLSLGFWQLDRKAWKEALLRQIEARAHKEPLAVAPEAEWSAWRQADGEYRRVRVEGDFLPDRLIALHGLAELRARQATQGYYLFQPLRRDDGTLVMINRGFVPSELRDATVAKLRAEPTRAEVTGLVRAPETRGLFVPENEPARGEWWVRNLDDMAKAQGLSRLAPFYIDAAAPSDPNAWPRGGQTQLTLRNSHLQYVVTWFGLAATLVGVFGAFAWGRLRRRA